MYLFMPLVEKSCWFAKKGRKKGKKKKKKLYWAAFCVGKLGWLEVTKKYENGQTNSQFYLHKLKIPFLEREDKIIFLPHTFLSRGPIKVIFLCVSVLVFKILSKKKKKSL